VVAEREEQEVEEAQVPWYKGQFFVVLELFTLLQLVMVALVGQQLRQALRSNLVMQDTTVQ